MKSSSAFVIAPGVRPLRGGTVSGREERTSIVGGPGGVGEEDDESDGGVSVPAERGKTVAAVLGLLMGVLRPLHSLYPSTDLECENNESPRGSWNRCWERRVSVR